MSLIILSAFLGILAFPPFGIYPLGFIFLAPFFIFLLREKKLFKLLWGAFIFRFFLFLGIALFAFEPFILLLSILIFLSLPLSVFLIKRGLTKFFPDLSLVVSHWLLVISLPFLWTFFDHLQARYSLLPTYLITAGNIFGSSPFLGLAGIGGLFLLTFFVALINSLIAVAILHRNYTISGGSISLIIILIFGTYLISQTQLQKNEILYQKLPTKVKIALLSNNEKFDKEFDVFENDILSTEEKTKAEIIINDSLKPIKTELADKQIEILILPEDMIDIESWEDIDEEAKSKFGIENAGILIKAYRQLAKELNTNLAATLTTIQNNKRYNSTLLFSKEGELVDIYNKFNLTILGEYWPFSNWQPFYYALIQKMVSEKIGQGETVFNEKYAYQPGQKKILQKPIEELIFGSAICSEIQYPWQMKDFKKMGAKFISHTTTNRWITVGLKNFMGLTNNLRKIEAVWLQLPILINGRLEMAGIITPDGQMHLVNFENRNRNFEIFIGEIKTK